MSTRFARQRTPRVVDEDEPDLLLRHARLFQRGDDTREEGSVRTELSTTGLPDVIPAGVVRQQHAPE